VQDGVSKSESATVKSCTNLSCKVQYLYSCVCSSLKHSGMLRSADWKISFVVTGLSESCSAFFFRVQSKPRYKGKFESLKPLIFLCY